MKTPAMNSLFSLAAAGLFLTACEAKAATYYYTETIPPTTIGWSHDFVFEQFDPASGDLNSVSIYASESLHIDLMLENNMSGDWQSFTFQGGGGLTLSLPGSLGGLGIDLLGPEQGYTLPPGGSDWYGPFDISDSAGGSYTASDDLTGFIGTGTVTLPGFTYPSERISPPSGWIAAAPTTLAGATVEVWYDFVPVPEPGPFALLALGSAALLRRRRGAFSLSQRR